jgi:hypothetical protein
MADMKTVRGTLNGATVETSEENAKRLGSAFVPEGSTEPAPEGYSTMKVDALKAEIAKRNEGREEADLLSDEGLKADLIATLEADDNK